jgi:hypothetical protein
MAGYSLTVTITVWGNFILPVAHGEIDLLFVPKCPFFQLHLNLDTLLTLACLTMTARTTLWSSFL